MKFEIQLYKEFEPVAKIDVDDVMELRVVIEQQLYAALHHGDVTQLYIERFEDKKGKEIDYYA